MMSLNMKAGSRPWGLLLMASLFLPQAAAAATLPGLNLTQYCVGRYGSGAYATLQPGQNNAYGWTCVVNGTYQGMNLNDACTQQQPGSYGAAYYDFNNPGSWYCQFRTTYTTQSNASTTMYVWKGDFIALLTPDTTTCSPPHAMTIVTGIDKGYKFYRDVTGRTPTLNQHYNNKPTFAAVPTAYGPYCGSSGTTANACGQMGSTGVEFRLSGTFESMCTAAATSTGALYDQTPFYELGRNFWFYKVQLAPGTPQTKQGDAFTTGYAVAMRFLAMEYEGLPGANINGYSFATMKRQVKKLMDTYATDTSTCASTTSSTRYPGSSSLCYRYDWWNTLKSGSAVSNSYGLGNADLVASVVLRLHRVHNSKSFLTRLWDYVGRQPEAVSDENAARNFVIAASQAAGVNLADVFQVGWRWPVDANMRAFLQTSLGSPVSTSTYLTPDP